MNDNLYLFKTLYGKDYESFAQAFIFIKDNFNVNFKIMKLTGEKDITYTLPEFILNCIANPLNFNAEQPFVDAFFVFAKKTFLPVLKQTNLLFLFFNSLKIYSLGLIPHDNFNFVVNTLEPGPFHLYKRHNLKFVDDITLILKNELTNNVIKIKYKPSMPFDDMKKHFFYMNKELINFNNKALNILLMLNSQIFCSFFNWPLLGFYGTNNKSEITTLKTEDWTAPFNDPSLKKILHNCIHTKINKKSNKKSNKAKSSEEKII